MNLFFHFFHNVNVNVKVIVFNSRFLKYLLISDMENSSLSKIMCPLSPSEPIALEMSAYLSKMVEMSGEYAQVERKCRKMKFARVTILRSFHFYILKNLHG